MIGQDPLFDPGPKSPNRWALHPDKWVDRPDVVHHSSSQPILPRVDSGYMGEPGMHVGTKAAAYDRATTGLGHREFLHTARLNTEKAPPPEHLAKWRGDSKNWTDYDANYLPEATAAVNRGKAVPYINGHEDAGSVSYRVKPENLRTWHEDVLNDDNAHPALKHLAARGYNPMMSLTAAQGEVNSAYASRQNAANQLFGADLVVDGKVTATGTTGEMSERQLDLATKGVTGAGIKRFDTPKSMWESRALINGIKPTLRPGRDGRLDP